MFSLLQISANYLFVKPLVSLPSRDSPNKNLWLLQKDPAYDYNAHKSKPPSVKDRKTLEACFSPNPFIKDQASELLDYFLTNPTRRFVAEAIINSSNESWDKENILYWYRTKYLNPTNKDETISALSTTALDNLSMIKDWSIAGRQVALQNPIKAIEGKLDSWLRSLTKDKSHNSNVFALNTYTGNGCRLWRYTEWQGYRLDKGGKNLKVLRKKAKNYCFFLNFNYKPTLLN